MTRLLATFAVLLAGCPAPAPRPTTPRAEVPPPREPDPVPEPIAPPSELVVRETEAGAVLSAGAYSHTLTFERAAAVDVPDEHAALPVRIEGALMALGDEEVANAGQLRFLVRAAVRVDPAQCVGPCEHLAAFASEHPAWANAARLYVRAPEVDVALAAGRERGRGWILDGGPEVDVDVAHWIASALDGPRWWALARARYLQLLHEVRADDAPATALRVALADRYAAHRRAHRTRPVAAGRDPDGAVLVAFCADLRDALRGPPPAEGHFRGVLELDGCLREAGLHLVAVRGPALDARMRRRLLQGATAEGDPPVVTRSPGPLRPGDRLLRLHRTRLRALADLDLAVATLERRQRVLLRYEREGQTRRQWITIPRLESDTEFVRFVIEAPDRWPGPPALLAAE